MQTFLALSIVAVAAGYLGWRSWKVVAGRKGAGCGTGCSSCPASENSGLPQQKPLVTIAPLGANKRDEARI
jgi:hypothetical protein